MESTIIDYFVSLITIDSESKEEKDFALKLEKDLKELGATVRFDNANENTGGNIGNLYAYFAGNIKKEPILLCAHMDTVSPGKCIKPKILEDRITSDGTTILGSDDKSGIAQIIWAIKELQENKEEYAPIEVLFTISEEIGLLGAKQVDYSLIQSKIGFALDTHNVGEITIGAPSQNSIVYTVHGKESHAGVNPEDGLNAIKIASEAITLMPMGRIDKETTCNVGVIEGGKATNIVPNKVIVKVEVRSHNDEKLKRITDEISQAFLKTVKKYKIGKFQAKVDIQVEQEYKSFHLDEDSLVIKLAEKASDKIGIPFKKVITGGGSDVNIFNKNGFEMPIAGTGMMNVHTVDEFILIKDLENGARWVKEIIRNYSQM